MLSLPYDGVLCTSLPCAQLLLYVSSVSLSETTWLRSGRARVRPWAPGTGNLNAYCFKTVVQKYMKNDSDGEGAGVCLLGNVQLSTQGFALRVNDKERLLVSHMWQVCPSPNISCSRDTEYVSRTGGRNWEGLAFLPASVPCLDLMPLTYVMM